MKKTNKNLYVLMSIIFLDMIGVGVLLPILAPLLLTPGNAFVDPAWSVQSVNILIGFLIASYPIMQFFGSPILGTLSDKHGRKKILSLSLFGSLIGYVLFAIGLYTANLPLLFVSRALDGFTGGNVSVANSSIADMTAKKDRAKIFGYVGVAFGMGFILGPFIGGFLSDSDLVSWFNPSIPFLFAAGLTAINLTGILFAYEETAKKRLIQKLSIFLGFQRIGSAFRHKRLRNAFISILFFWLGFSFFTQFLPVFFVNKFNMDESQIGNMFGFIGIMIAVNQGILVPLLAKRYKPNQILRWSFFGASLTILVSVLADSVGMQYIAQWAVAVFAATSIPNIQALVSQEAPENEQGEMLGITQSMSAFGHAIAPLIAGFVVSFGMNIPHLIASACIFIAGLVFFFGFRKRKLTASHLRG